MSHVVQLRLASISTTSLRGVVLEQVVDRPRGFRTAHSSRFLKKSVSSDNAPPPTVKRKIDSFGKENPANENTDEQNGFCSTGCPDGIFIYDHQLSSRSSVVEESHEAEVHV
jgi:hypothetical protein